MKKIQVAVNDANFLRQLKALFLPLEYELVMIKLEQFIAEADLSETELLIIDPMLAEIGIASGLIDTLKSRNATSRIPILLCSSHDNNDAIVTCMNAGASDFILLPSPSRLIKTRVQALLDK